MMKGQVLHMSSSSLKNKEILVSQLLYTGGVFWFGYFISHWSISIKQVCKKVQAFWFTALSFWRLLYTMQTHAQFHAYSHY